VTHERVYELPEPFPIDAGKPCRVTIPVTALESADGVAALRKLRVPLPDRLASRIESIPYQVSVRCRYGVAAFGATQSFELSALATAGGRVPDEYWAGWDWRALSPSATTQPETPGANTGIVCPDRSLPDQAALWLQAAETNSPQLGEGGRMWVSRRLQGAALRDFPEVFLAWLDQRPPNITVELDPELDSFLHGRVSGSMRLEIEESGVDWFDVRVALDLSDVELTEAEIDILLKAKGRWVRLPNKGWRKLEYQLSEEQQAQLADLGLAAGDLTKSESQRLHVFQLSGAAGAQLLPPERVVEVKRRAEELRTSVTPEVPAAITASLRPYQREGYHFLAYLAANRFGGILADDMGLGKTVQTLSWLAWLRETGQLDGPALVVCPKSVQDNWRAEVARFCPGLRVRQWTGETAGIFEDPAPAPPSGNSARKAAKAPPPGDDLVIINYTQLRLHEQALVSRKWSAVVLDEAQYIKNPSSQTAKAACALQAGHRLALSGTPIENRLLDLWSIMNFAMPGALGNRTAFNRQFNGRDDPLARRRLAARVRPFVLRRTKKEVAQDLPDRTEEEIICQLEGPQAALYRAELKRARAVLLKAKTAAQLDKLRFNILTSLLRLRQICCHPSLIGSGKPEDESAKLGALLDMLEPLVEEGHKVLVFSQFVEMLELIRAAAAERDWPHLVLTGQTEDRGALVDRFQHTEGASIFLISLKAGGFGLNLTAASYVVLFDPWWNPAVENQAIDRTHRIGQSNKVIAYRLIARDTIEEKIRELQKKKSALASDVLGEEGFAKALTLDDFRFLLGEGDSESPS
jgi:superfamily II DNA or RNA helicase